MADPTDEKIELLVRSVLAAVDARLVEVRSEIQAVAVETEQRNREVLARLQALELRWETRAAETGSVALDGDLLGARMEQATQVLLERIEAMHQRNTMATNERFAQINNALGQLSGIALAPSAPVGAPAPLTHVAPAASAPAAPAAPSAPSAPAPAPAPTPTATTPTTMPSLDAMNAPFQVGPISDEMPVAATLPSSITLPPIPPLTSAPPSEPNGEPAEPIDMSRLAEMLSERLGSLSLPPQQ